ncbi:hypothetical protein HDU67_003438 [Dinochytrium kinnereticum]|nr:hypothetical protein HDU67_003438 [Dinochytrium kinnereticum]
MQLLWSIASVVAGLAVVVGGQAQASLSRLEPPNGRLLFGAWIDTSPQGADSPARFNERIGRQASLFQFAQTIPLERNDDGILKSFNYTQIDEGSDAMILLTVYPYEGFANVTQSEIDRLSDEIAEIRARTGRSVLVRYAPEMNFEWMPYGQQPAEFIASFRQLATTLHERNPNAATLWSPNFDARDGSTYERYYPAMSGDEYVDWVGLSVYFKGVRADWPWITNTNPPENYFDQLVNAGGPEGGPVPFYDIYAAGKGKPFAVSEGASTFHVNYSTNAALGPFTADPSAPGVTQTSVQMAFWNSFLFSPSYLDSHPLLKLVCLFEYAKPENESTYLVNRDFRSTWDPTTLSTFRSSLDSISSRIIWANASTISVTTTSTTAASTSASIIPTSTSVVSSTVLASTATTTPSSAGELGFSGWRMIISFAATAATLIVCLSIGFIG